MVRPSILHLLTPAPQASPFDVNMAVDGGFEHVIPYTGVTLDEVTGLVQDAIFSRSLKALPRTGLFIGGRDVVLATDMLEAARRALVPPFVISVFADPSGAYTTAAALVALAAQALRRHHQTDFNGKEILVLGGSGSVGRIAGAMASRIGGRVLLANRKDGAAASAVSRQTNTRFDCATEGIVINGPDRLRQALATADLVFATAAAGVQVLSADDVTAAGRLLVACDVNAVPPAGIAGIDAHDKDRRLPGAGAIGIGALAIGNLKYQVNHQLFAAMLASDKALSLGFAEAMTRAFELSAD